MEKKYLEIEKVGINKIENVVNKNEFAENVSKLWFECMPTHSLNIKKIKEALEIYLKCEIVEIEIFETNIRDTLTNMYVNNGYFIQYKYKLGNTILDWEFEYFSWKAMNWILDNCKKELEKIENE